MQLVNQHQAMGNRLIKRNSLMFSLIYVGLGTISVLGMYPESPVYWEWSFLGLLITLPVSALSFGISYMESGNYVLILLIQFGVFILCWLIVYRVMLRRQGRKEKRMNK